MISNSNRIKAVKLIDEARENGARLEPACKELGISSRTYQRWTKNGDVKKDQRPLIKRKVPKNKLTKSERKEIIEITNSKEYANLQPSKIVPKTEPNQVLTWAITWFNAFIKGKTLPDC